MFILFMFGIEDTANSLAIHSKTSLDGSPPMFDVDELSLHDWTVEPGGERLPRYVFFGIGVWCPGDVLVLGLQVQGVLQRTDAREVDELKKILDGPLEGYG